MTPKDTIIITDRVSICRWRPSGKPVLRSVLALWAAGATAYGQAGALDMNYDPSVFGGRVHALAVQPDGKTLIGGLITGIAGVPRSHLARLNLNGSLDTTFTASASGEVHSIVVQPDGRILIGGEFGLVNGEERGGLARLNPDGSLESTATFLLPGWVDSGVECMALQPDGKILIGGRFGTIGGTSRNRIARLNPNGSLESTATFNPGTGANDNVTSIALQNDGKILIGGQFSAVGGASRNGLARLNANGSLEGTATFNIGTGASQGTLRHRVVAVAAQPDGKILVCGDFTTFNGVNRRSIARLAADGSLEGAATFNPGSGADSEITSVILQADGRILAGGPFDAFNGAERHDITRLRTDGVPETPPAFNPGEATGQSAGFEVDGLALQTDGKILLGGTFMHVNQIDRRSLARLQNDPAAQSLTVPDATRVRWIRGGSAAEISQVTLELSTTGGATWNPVGVASRTAGGWERTGLNLPVRGLLRARGRTSSGYGNGSSGIVEAVAAFDFNPPPADPFSWGQNDRGQLGDLSTTNHGLPAPVNVSGALAGKKVVDIAGGEVHSMALTSDGRVYAWGYNLFGQVGDNSTTDRTAPAAVNTSGVLAGKTVKAIAAGVHQCMVLTTDGGLFSWGINDGGVLGDGTTSPRHVPVAVNMTGALAGKTVTAITQGEIHCMALTSDGQVYAWGSNLYGQLGDSTNSNRGTSVAVNTAGVLAGKTVVAIGTGRFHSLAVTSEGKVYAWGLNNEGQLGDGTTTDRNVPVAVNMTGALAGRTVTEVDGGYSQTLALTSDGKLFAWGLNDRGQLGDSTNTDRLQPVAVNMTGALAGKTVVSMRTRRDHCLALTSDGKLFAWGYNSVGQLGDGTTTTRNAPVAISLPGKTVTAIDAGSRHSLIAAIVPEIAVEQPAGTALADGVSTVNFGTVPLRSTASRDFVIRNTGPDALTLTGMTLTGPAAEDFTISSSPLSFVPAGGSVTFTIHFGPASAGTKTAALRILSNDSDENSFDVNLSATAIEIPELTVHSNAAEEPEVFSGQAEPINTGTWPLSLVLGTTLNISNTGPANLVVNSISATPPFTVQIPNGPGQGLPRTLGFNQGFGFGVKVVTNVPGTFTGTLTITSSDPDEGTFTLPLTGTVITPEISLFDGPALTAPEITNGQAEPVNFGTTRQGTPVIRSLLIANTGTDSLRVESMTLPAGYTLLNEAPFPDTLNPGETVVLNVRLDATAPQTFAGNAIITSDDVDEPAFAVPLSGTVVTPEITVKDGAATGADLTDGQAAAINFGRNVQGTPGSRSFTIVNTGTAELKVTGVTVPAGYSVLNLPALPLTAAVNQTVTFQVSLTTTAAGPHAGSVTILSDDVDEAVFDFPITGEVFIPDPAATTGGTTAALNRQTGLREQVIHITNDTTATVPAYNLIIRGLPAGVEVNNASETRADGSVVVYIRQGMQPRSSQEIVIEYYSPDRTTADISPQLSTEVVLNPPDLTAPATDTGLTIGKVTRLTGGEMLIEFNSEPGKRYQIQYSADGQSWQNSLPQIRAASNRTQWIDRGLPRTDSPPGQNGSRLYRVRETAP